MALGLEVLDGLLVTDLGSAKLLIADVRLEATNAVTDVLRVVYGLRPPALDLPTGASKPTRLWPRVLSTVGRETAQHLPGIWWS